MKERDNFFPPSCPSLLTQMFEAEKSPIANSSTSLYEIINRFSLKFRVSSYHSDMQ